MISTCATLTTMLGSTPFEVELTEGDVLSPTEGVLVRDHNVHQLVDGTWVSKGQIAGEEVIRSVFAASPDDLVVVTDTAVSWLDWDGATWTRSWVERGRGRHHLVSSVQDGPYVAATIEGRRRTSTVIVNLVSEDVVRYRSRLSTFETKLIGTTSFELIYGGRVGLSIVAPDTLHGVGLGRVGDLLTGYDRGLCGDWVVHQDRLMVPSIRAGSLRQISRLPERPRDRPWCRGGEWTALTTRNYQGCFIIGEEHVMEIDADGAVVRTMEPKRVQGPP